jgi:hypothetical protein
MSDNDLNVLTYLCAQKRMFTMVAATFTSIIILRASSSPQRTVNLKRISVRRRRHVGEKQINGQHTNSGPRVSYLVATRARRPVLSDAAERAKFR